MIEKKSSNVARFVTSKIGMLALAAILIVGSSASMAAAQGNGKGGDGNPFGALSAAIGEIQQQVDDLFADNEAQQEQIDGLIANQTNQEGIDALESQIADMNEQIALLQDAVADLQAQIDAVNATSMEADEALQSNIDAEEAARIETDFFNDRARDNLRESMDFRIDQLQEDIRDLQRESHEHDSGF